MLISNHFNKLTLFSQWKSWEISLLTSAPYIHFYSQYAHAEIGDKSLQSGFSPVILDVSAWIFCCSVAAVFIMACIRSALLLVFGSSLPYTWGRSWLPVDDPDPPYPELISFPRLWRASENLLRTPSTLNVNPPRVFTLALFKFPSWTLFLSWALFFGLGLASSRSTLENIETLTYLVYVNIYIIHIYCFFLFDPFLDNFQNRWSYKYICLLQTLKLTWTINAHITFFSKRRNLIE